MLFAPVRELLEATAMDAKLAAEALDVTLPGRGEDVGSIHPVTRTMERISEYFRTIGFTVESGPRD